MLLLYSVRMVRTGVERASGPTLRRTIADPTRSRIASATVGILIAVLLQSSTATAVLASGFAVSGLLTLTGGLALMLGADLGTALVVQFLSLDLTWLTPFLLTVGGWLFLKFSSRTLRQCGRILIGIAFILISLKMIGAATEPLKQSDIVPQIAGYLAEDYFTAFVVGVVATFIIHSSVASVLMIAAFAAQGILQFEAGIALLLGANVGGGLVALWLTRGFARKARLAPIGNLLFRLIGALAVLALIPMIQSHHLLIGNDLARQVINIHLLFNLALLVVCLPLVGTMSVLVQLVVPTPSIGEKTQERLRPVSALDRSVIKSPRLALASATRELLRMSELVEVMLRPVMVLFETANSEEVDRIRKIDREVNDAYTNIKLYIAEINRGELSSEDAERGIDLTSFAINIERAGDIVSKNLLDQVAAKNKLRVMFSDAGLKELTNLHDRVMANMQLALNVLVSGDLESARQLIAEKDYMRTLERESHNRHLSRLQAGAKKSIESSDIHLETMRALKEINSLFASVAIPILSKGGQLRESRLLNSEGRRTATAQTS